MQLTTRASSPKCASCSLDFSINPVAARELGLAEPEENGATFCENARIKAICAAAGAGLPALADDSGLALDALGGQPGIYSARWAGPHKDFRRAMHIVEEKLRERGAHEPSQRKAHFICALCIAWPDRHVEEFEATVDGMIIWPPRGEQGFGYDRIFVPDGHARTFGEMPGSEAWAAAGGRRPLPPRTRLPQAGGGLS